MSKRRVGVVGATGYAGAELARLLLSHPDVELAAVVSRGRAGERLDAVHPGLLGCTDLVFETFNAKRLADLDVVMLAVPHGQATALVSQLDGAYAKSIIDLSADHRHADGWVFGQAEWHADQLAGAKRIAVPGCFATSVMLACAPFAAAGRLTGPVRCVAATGSTGLGATPKQAGHHPERLLNLKAYKVLSHQHGPEISTFLTSLGPFPGLRFVPLSAPLDRGILATCFFELSPRCSLEEARSIVSSAYAPHPLVRVREAPPEVRHLRGTAFCDLAVFEQDGEVVVLSAIDNLVKGAAGQAVQCLNLSLGLAVDSGLRGLPCLP